MSNEDILKLAIKKAHENGWNWSINKGQKFPHYGWLAGYMLIGKNGAYPILFDHGFAKAFFKPSTDKCDKCNRKWISHLKNMVRDENPIGYLENFLGETYEIEHLLKEDSKEAQTKKGAK